MEIDDPVVRDGSDDHFTKLVLERFNERKVLKVHKHYDKRRAAE